MSCFYLKKVVAICCNRLTQPQIYLYNIWYVMIWYSRYLPKKESSKTKFLKFIINWKKKNVIGALFVLTLTFLKTKSFSKNISWIIIFLYYLVGKVLKNEIELFSIIFILSFNFFFKKFSVVWNKDIFQKTLKKNTL